MALGLYLVGRWQGAASMADAAAVREAQTILSLKGPYLARLAKLQQVERQHDRQAQTWRAIADSLRQLAQLVDTLVLPDSGPVARWQQIANAEREGAHECVLALRSCQDRAFTAETRAAQLDSSLAALLKVHDCRILFVRCPSRTAMGLGGLGLGTILGLVLAR